MIDLLLGRAGVWLAGLLLLAGSFVSGYVKGRESEQKEQKLAMAEIIVKRIERIKTVYINDGNVSEAYEKGRKEREDEFKRLKAELEQAKLDAISPSCNLPDDVVRLLNTPRASRLSSSPEKSSSSLRGAGAAEGWKATNLGSHNP